MKTKDFKKLLKTTKPSLIISRYINGKLPYLTDKQIEKLIELKNK